MKEITEEMLNELVDKFHKYTETAEQHEFVVLAMVQQRIENTNISKIVNNQREARAMYRTIARVIFEDYSEFKE